MQRFAVTPVLTVAVFGFVHQRRLVGHNEPGTNKRKVNLDDDDRWIEAEFDEKLRTPEERYAHERQREVLKSLIGKLRSENTEKLQDAVNKRNEEIDSIKTQMAEMEKKLNELTKR